MIDREKTFNEMWNSIRNDKHFTDINDFDLEAWIDEQIEEMIEEEQEESIEIEIIESNIVEDNNSVCPVCGKKHNQELICTKETESSIKYCITCNECNTEYSYFESK